MKNILLFLALLSSLSVHSQTRYSENGIDYIVKKADNARDFWLSIYNNHPRNIEVDKKIRKKNGRMTDAFNSLKYMDGWRDYVSSRSVKSDDAQKLIASVEEMIKIENTFPAVKLFVVDGNTPNVVMSIDGTLMINSYWLEPDAKIEELIAICCHEASHYVIVHEIRDRLNAIEDEYKMYRDLSKDYYDVLWNLDVKQTYMYKIQTEEEADEVAFWFMEKNGIDPIHFINLLKRMESSEPVLSRAHGKVSNHQDMSKRIKSLEYLYKFKHKKK